MGKTPSVKVLILAPWPNSTRAHSTLPNYSRSFGQTFQLPWLKLLYCSEINSLRDTLNVGDMCAWLAGDVGRVASTTS